MSQATDPAERPLLERADAVYLILLTLFGFVLVMAFRTSFGTAGLALGSDPVLWGLSSKNVSVGVPSEVPPLYPSLMALLDPIRGVSVIDAGLFISFIANVAVVPATYLSGRYLGATRLIAALVCLMIPVTPGLVRFGVQISPDALTTLMLVLSVPVVGRFLVRPSWRRFAVLALYGALASLLREHGMVLMLLFAGVAALGRATLQTRAARVGVILAGVCLAPALTLHSPNLPWENPWTSRITEAVGGVEKEPMNPQPEIYARQVAHEKAHEEGDRIGIAKYHVWHTYWMAPVEWTWLGLGGIALLVGVQRKRWIPAIVPVMPSLSALLVFSQARHVTVAVPVAIAVFAAALSGNRWLKGLGAIGLVVLAVRGANNWKAYPNLVEMKVSSAENSRSAGQALCELAAPGDLASGRFYDARVYCPVRHTGLVDDDVAWNTWMVTNSSPGRGWVKMSDIFSYYGDSYAVFQYRPDLEGEDRPCHGSVAAADTPYFSAERYVAELDPPCNQMNP